MIIIIISGILILINPIGINNDASKTNDWIFKDHSLIRNGEEIIIDCEYTLDYFIDSLHIFSRKVREFKKYRDSLNRFGVDSYTLDTIGLVSDYRVLDVNYNFNAEFSYKWGKFIIVETSPNKYKPLVFVLNSDGVFINLNPTEIVIAGNNEIISTKSPYYGQTTELLEDYWIWDEESGCFVSLNHWDVISTFVKKNIGETKGIQWLGSFNVDSLYLESYVRNPEDYHWATGGFIWMKFEIEGLQLKVKSYKYDPDVKASH